MDLFLSGGVLSWVLLAFGAVAVLLFIERLLRLRGAGVNVEDLLDGIKTLLARGGDAEALSQCDETGGPASAVMRVAVIHRASPQDALREALNRMMSPEASPMAAAQYTRDFILPAMESLRGPADEAETLIPGDLWPYPTCGELIFSV